MGKLYLIPTPVGNMEGYHITCTSFIERSGPGFSRRHAYQCQAIEAL